MDTINTKQQKAFKELQKEFGYTNIMQTPRLVKVVLNSGIGSIKDKNKIEVIQDRMALISGQKVASRIAKKSIAGFKMREGDTVGYQITLRGERMYSFLDKLINVALPRTKDFRGLSSKGIDEMGNFTIGIKEHTVFPETSDEELRNVFGFSITIVTTAKNKNEAEAFFKHIGFPLKEEALKD